MHLDYLHPHHYVPIMVLEYFNVSKFEDLPLLFTERLKEDIPYYSENGVLGFTYMHLPMVNWALRTLTQVLYAELIWNPDADVHCILEEYFCNRYGAYAEEMKEVYRLSEEAWRFCTSWRAWKNKSLLSRLQGWDGEEPKAPLKLDDHFGTPESFEKMGSGSEAMLSEAMDILENVIKTAKCQKTDIVQLFHGMPVNPVELRKHQRNLGIERNLGEDKRLLIYGLDTLRMMHRLGAYHNALYERDAARTGRLWQEIEQLEDKLESYYMPLTYDNPKVGLMSRDALTRTQLGDVIRRCRQYRLKAWGGKGL